MNPDIDRQNLRRRVLDLRNNIPESDRRKKSSLIMEKLCSINEFNKAATIFIYVNFRSEAETLPLISKCLERGIRVAVPLTVAGSSTMLAIAIEDPGHDLKPGYCGIPEPDPGRLPAVEPGEIDIVIVPGSVFDEQGGRLGYGGGYYDRFLSNSAPTAVRIGLAFEVQVIPAIALEPHDQLLNYLVTDKTVRAFNNKL